MRARLAGSAKNANTSTRGFGSHTRDSRMWSGIWGSTQVSYLAIYYTTASNAVILQAATPVIVGLGAWLYLGERLARRQWAGVVLSGFGVLLVITDGRLAALRPEELRAGDFINLIGLCGWR